MALNPQERATTANQMMQILNNSGGGGDISQLTERVEVLEEQVPVIAAEVVEHGNRITALEENSGGLKIFKTTATLSPNPSGSNVNTSVAISASNFPELYLSISNIIADPPDIIEVTFNSVKSYFYKDYADSTTITFTRVSTGVYLSISTLSLSDFGGLITATNYKRSL